MMDGMAVSVETSVAHEAQKLFFEIGMAQRVKVGAGLGRILIVREELGLEARDVRREALADEVAANLLDLRGGRAESRVELRGCEVFAIRRARRVRNRRHEVLDRRGVAQGQDDVDGQPLRRRR